MKRWMTPVSSKILFATILCCIALQIRASGGGGHDEKPEAAEGHGGGHEEKPAAEGHGGGGEHAAAPAAPLGPNRHYNPGPVESFPKEISGVDLFTGKTFTYNPTRGRATIVFFIASWCEPCQQLMPKIKVLANKYTDVYTDVIFVFAHDTKEDAAGFAKEHKLAGRVLLANHEILKSFKNPALPAVYIGDRYNYLGHRAVKFSDGDLEALNSYLTKLTLL